MISSGAGNSRVFELRAPMMVKDDYTNVTMKCSVWQKDMDVIGSFAKKIGVPTPLFTATEPFTTPRSRAATANTTPRRSAPCWRPRQASNAARRTPRRVRCVSLLRPSGGVSGSVSLG